MSRKFQCIVVGAGPAGTTTALLLARAGIEVLVVERGLYPGSKNVFGGAFHCRGFSEIVPDFWQQAPIERPITRWMVSFLTHERSFSLDLRCASHLEPPYHACTVLRSKFDSWYAKVAAEAGAVILCETLAEDLLRENGRVVGIRVARDQGELLADVVVAADGVNSQLVRKAGLRRNTEPQDAFLGVKQILELPPEVIEKTFTLRPGEGMAQTFLGSAALGIEGGGFLYTNRESLSLGFVTRLSSLVEHKTGPEDVWMTFTRHPMIRPLIQDALYREYCAHLIPETSALTVDRLYTGGLLVVGDAADLVLSTGFRHEGANYAILSGIAAAETVKAAHRKKDFSKTALKAYGGFLAERGVVSDFRRFRHLPSLFRNKRLYQGYPELVCSLAENLFRGDAGRKEGFRGILKKSAKGNIRGKDLFKDALAALRAFG